MVNIVTFTSQIPAGDQSCQYLGQIFGPMNGVVCHYQGTDTGQTLTLLGSMFQAFNAIILAIAALVILYVTVVGVMHTAQEGEFMGRNWNNIWLPIRMVFGVAFLIPTGSGYSALQIVMMWVIVQGIGAADMLWGTALRYLNIAGSPYAQLSVPSTAPATAFPQLFQGLVCDATARVTSSNLANVSGGGYYCNQTSNTTFCNSSPNFPQANTACQGEVCTYKMGPNGNCGEMNYCNMATVCSGDKTDTLKCAACKAQNAQLPVLVAALNKGATAFAAVDLSYRDFYARSYAVGNDASWEWIYAYCSKNNIPRNQCCIRSLDPSLANSQVCPPESGSGNFPSPNAGGNPQSPDKAAVANLYLPFGLPALMPDMKGASFIKVASDYYTTQVSHALADWAAGQDKQMKPLDNDLEKAKESGWIFAGAYYYVIAKMNKEAVENSVPVLQVTLSDPNTNEMGKYRNNFTAAQILVSEAAGAAGKKGTFSGAGVPQLTVLQGALDGTMDSLNGSMNDALSGSGTDASVDLGSASVGGNTEGPDAISRLIHWGNSLMTAGTVTIAILIPITIGLGIAGYISPFVLGTGIINPAGGAINLLYTLLVPALYAFCGFLIGLGATLAIYVPLIPYIIFTFGAIGWLLSTVEAMVAGPLVALGIISPSKQHHELLGKAEPALMLIFNIFLRPSLMIFGLIAAILLSKVILTMIDTVFWSLVKDAIVGEAPGPLQYIVFLLAYVALVVAALNKCFAAIYIIPQQVMMWIGGQGAQYGEAEAASEVRGKTEQAGQMVGGAAAGTEATAKTGATETHARTAERKKQQNAGPTLE